MNTQRHETDILIIGAGPAGIAAALAASESGRRVSIVDDNAAPGGQIWRGEARKTTSPEGAEWLHKLRQTNTEFIHGAKVVTQPEQNVLRAETWSGAWELRYQKLILATGARECFLPFPGWTLPNVTGAGGLQALVKNGWPIKGQRVVIAGSGPLLMAVAAYLKKQGAEVLLIAEQASMSRLLKFGIGLLREPHKAMQALDLKTELTNVPLLTGCWPVAAYGKDKLESVRLRRGFRLWEVECDYLACGFHLVPSLELAALLGCEIQQGCVRVNSWQQTSVANIYCAGESTGIGGLDLSLIEGQIAGYATTEQRDKAEPLFAARDQAQRFADRLNTTFALRDELKTLPQPETIICRCEDVSFAQLQSRADWKDAKWQTRCGMGPCQGRICGAATEFLFDWQHESMRPPACPARIETLVQSSG